MIELIKSVLTKIDGISGWKIIETATESSELFFVKKNLDMDRAKNVTFYKVTVYKFFEDNGQKFTGSSATNIHPTMTEEEVAEAIKSAAFASSFVKNEYYPLAEKNSDTPVKMNSKFAEKPMKAWLGDLVDAVYKVDNHENGGINSTEVFLHKTSTRLVTSTGIDECYDSYKGEIEFIVTWKEDGEEIELYKKLDFTEPNFESITKEVEKLLTFGRDRAIAKPTPSLGKHTVLISGEAVRDFFGFYTMRSAASSVYNRISTLKLGENVQGTSITGDALNIKIDPFIENSTESRPFDMDGIVLKPLSLYENGVLKNYEGDLRHAHYLNIIPTGSCGNLVVKGGSKSLDEIKADPYLEVVAFSSFQMDPMTGDFGGEIRLAYYFDGKERIPVAGGSATGVVSKIHDKMFLSSELQKENNFIGPEAIQFFNLSVGGF